MAPDFSLRTSLQPRGAYMLHRRIQCLEKHTRGTPPSPVEVRHPFESRHQGWHPQHAAAAKLLAPRSRTLTDTRTRNQCVQFVLMARCIQRAQELGHLLDLNIPAAQSGCTLLHSRQRINSMKTIVVRNKDELTTALKSDADEIVIDSNELVKQLRAIKTLRKAGPIAIGVIVAAIPLIPVTGGGSLVAAAAAAGAATSGVGIGALCIAIGGILVIGIFTDWEEVELAGIFKLKRKQK
jgi:hypothetical protein